MIKLIRAEVFKLKKSKSFLLLCIIFAVLGFGTFLFSYFNDVLNVGESKIGLYDAFFANFADSAILFAILGGLFSGTFIGNDFSSRTIQSEITVGFSRFKILASKMTGFMLAIVVFVVVNNVFLILPMLVLHGGGSLEISNMLVSLLLFLLSVCASSSICMITAFLIQNKGTMIAVNSFLVVVVNEVFLKMIAFGLTNATKSDVFLNGYTMLPYSVHMRVCVHNIAKGDALICVIISACFIFSSLLISYGLFKKAELK